MSDRSIELMFKLLHGEPTYPFFDTMKPYAPFHEFYVEFKKGPDYASDTLQHFHAISRALARFSEHYRVGSKFKQNLLRARDIATCFDQFNYKTNNPLAYTKWSQKLSKECSPVELCEMLYWFPQVNSQIFRELVFVPNGLFYLFTLLSDILSALQPFFMLLSLNQEVDYFNPFPMSDWMVPPKIQ